MLYSASRYFGLQTESSSKTTPLSHSPAPASPGRLLDRPGRFGLPGGLPGQLGVWAGGEGKRRQVSQEQPLLGQTLQKPRG